LAATSALNLQLTYEPGELSQWLCHDDSTINIILVIIVITVIHIYLPNAHNVPEDPNNNIVFVNITQIQEKVA